MVRRARKSGLKKKDREFADALIREMEASHKSWLRVIAAFYYRGKKLDAVVEKIWKERNKK